MIPPRCRALAAHLQVSLRLTESQRPVVSIRPWPISHLATFQLSRPRSSPGAGPDCILRDDRQLAMVLAHAVNGQPRTQAASRQPLAGDLVEGDGRAGGLDYGPASRRLHRARWRQTRLTASQPPMRTSAPPAPVSSAATTAPATDHPPTPSTCRTRRVSRWRRPHALGGLLQRARPEPRIMPRRCGSLRQLRNIGTVCRHNPAPVHSF